jgi:hypothetical protein
MRRPACSSSSNTLQHPAGPVLDYQFNISKQQLRRAVVYKQAAADEEKPAAVLMQVGRGRGGQLQDSKAEVP